MRFTVMPVAQPLNFEGPAIAPMVVRVDLEFATNLTGLSAEPALGECVVYFLTCVDCFPAGWCTSPEPLLVRYLLAVPCVVLVAMSLGSFGVALAIRPRVFSSAVGVGRAPRPLVGHRTVTAMAGFGVFPFVVSIERREREFTIALGASLHEKNRLPDRDSYHLARPVVAA